MADDLDAFFTDLMQEVTATAAANGEFTRTTLVENLAGRLVQAEELQDWVPCFHEGRGSRNRVLGLDGYGVDELDLDGTRVTDDGVAWLVKALTESQPPAKLRALGLSNTTVGDAGIAALSKLTELEALHVEGTKVTDDGLKSLPPGLVELDLSDTAVTDEGVKTVAGLPKLKTLSVTGTKVTDDGLNALAGLTALRFVMVAGSRVTPGGATRFATARPGVEVDSLARW